ncbi:MAG: putative colanic acid biosynthesis acetyltransferase WcaF [Parvicella sp.]|jgi:putative colanic acid biosynthesis acetyltransferase WcaF
MNKVDLSKYENTLGFKHKILRVLFEVIWALFVRPLPRSMGNSWKIFILRSFGAKIHKTAKVYSSVRVYAPWNLQMEEYSCLAPEVDCYNVDVIRIGSNVTISQKVYLCAASHDITKVSMPLITKPISIKAQAWVGADAYIGMGVTIEEGAVVGAKACVYKDVPAWTIVGGNPAKYLKKREFTE